MFGLQTISLIGAGYSLGLAPAQEVNLAQQAITYAIGDIKMTAVNGQGQPPIIAGWLPCDGTAYPRVGQTANLFDAIGVTYGAPDGSTFNVPDFRSRIPVCGGIGAPAAPLAITWGFGQDSGREDLNLRASDIPSLAVAVTDPGHAHTATDSGHTHAAPSGNNFVTVGTGTQFVGAGNVGQNAAATGSGTASITVAGNTTGITAVTAASTTVPGYFPPVLAVAFYIRYK